MKEEDMFNKEKMRLENFCCENEVMFFTNSYFPEKNENKEVPNGDIKINNDKGSYDSYKFFDITTHLFSMGNKNLKLDKNVPVLPLKCKRPLLLTNMFEEPIEIAFHENNSWFKKSKGLSFGWIELSKVIKYNKDIEHFPMGNLLLNEKFEIVGITELFGKTGDYTGGLNPKLLIFAQNYKQYIDKKTTKFWKIDIRNSIKSKLENTTISLPRKLFNNNKLLKDGVTFIIDNRKISIWENNNKITVMLDTDNYYQPYIKLEFESKKLPKIINELEIKKILTQNEKKLEQEWENNYNEIMDINSINCDLNIMHKMLSEGKENKYYFFTAIKLIAAYSSPELRGEIKRIKKVKTQNTRLRTKKNIQYTKWVWGTDKLQYIYPNNKYNNKKIIHYCRPALAKYYISNLNKYKEYDILEEELNHWRYRYSIIKWRAGCWKGDKEKYYFAGNIGGGYSQKAIAWLKRVAKENEINIQHAENNKEFHIQVDENNYYLVDGYCKENNTVYEFHGDFWHGNPKQYDANDINPKNNKTYGELYSATLMKEKMIKSMGFKLITIWENKWDKMVRA